MPKGVKNDEIDTYINFLSVVAYHFFDKHISELPEDDFSNFLNEYENKYNLPVKSEMLLRNLDSCRIFTKSSCGNYCFLYSYLYYYFVAKYFSEHVSENKDRISHILANLHKDENAYIALFISHHTNNADILDELTINALCLFDGYQSATLASDELRFFDAEIGNITKAVLPYATESSENARKTRLQQRKLIEENNKKLQNDRENDADDVLIKELRRSIKTVEVMGLIVKNRAGSLEKTRIEEIINEGFNVLLRLLSYLFANIQNEDAQKDVVTFIMTKIRSLNKIKPEDVSHVELQNIAKTMFWNLNFRVVYGIVNKLIRSFGSDKLRSIISKICDERHTPAHTLFKHGCLMWYSKNIQVMRSEKR